MTSTNSPKTERPTPARAPGRVQVISIDEELLRALGDQYGQYRQAMSGPFDPVRALALTGKILEAVGDILASAQDSLETCPTNVGRYRQ